MTDEQPAEVTDWLRRSWNPIPEERQPIQFPLYSAARQCPVITPEWENPEGVPIDAILFGGRRGSVVPLVTEAFSWRDGSFWVRPEAVGQRRRP